ncbi:MAG: hypothetical protein H7A55_09480 [Verrucomicrobiaceae bacterium]|nr:hypothetical protein [Verrucomicrobiaceae bacterium]
MEGDKGIADQALHLFATAQKKASAESVYGKHMASLHLDRSRQHFAHRREEGRGYRGPSKVLRDPDAEPRHRQEGEAAMKGDRIAECLRITTP